MLDLLQNLPDKGQSSVTWQKKYLSGKCQQLCANEHYFAHASHYQEIMGSYFALKIFTKNKCSRHTVNKQFCTN